MRQAGHQHHRDKRRQGPGCHSVWSWDTVWRLPRQVMVSAIPPPSHVGRTPRQSRHACRGPRSQETEPGSDTNSRPHPRGPQSCKSPKEVNPWLLGVGGDVSSPTAPPMHPPGPATHPSLLSCLQPSSAQHLTLPAVPAVGQHPARSAGSSSLAPHRLRSRPTAGAMQLLGKRAFTLSDSP